MIKIVSITGILLISSLFISACSSVEFTEELEYSSISSPSASSTPEPSPSHTPEPSPSLPTETLTPIIIGIGVSRDEVQSAFEDLELVFEPQGEENGQKVTVGGIALSDASYIIVILTGPGESLLEASVTIMEPIMRLSLETESELKAAKIHGKWLFIMQVMVDAVFPYWEESSTWLDQTLRSFSEFDGAFASDDTIYQNATVTMEVEIMSGDLEGFLSVALIITVQ